MRQLVHEYRSKLQYTIIGPYLALMILVMLIGSFIALTLVTESWQERFDNQAAQVARNFAESFAQREIGNIDFLSQVSFTVTNPQTGAPAMRDRDSAGLELALRGLWQLGQTTENVQADRLIIFDTTGQALLDWERTPGNLTEPTRYVGTNLAGVPLVEKVLRGQSEPVGGSETVSDKYSGLLAFGGADGLASLHFYTVAPVYLADAATGQEQLVGGMLIAQRLDALLQDLQSRSQAAVSTIYDVSGAARASTAPGVKLSDLDMDRSLIAQAVALNESGAPAVAQAGNPANPCLDIGSLAGRLVSPIEQVRLPACSVTSVDQIAGREYQLVYAPLLIRGVQSGYFSVGLSTDFVVSAWSASRTAVIGVTAALALASVIIGWLVARRITRPLNQLVDTAEAISAGDLGQRSALKEVNELGTLSRSFDRMTESLVEALEQVRAEASKRSAILESLSDGVIVYDRAGQVELVNRAGRALLGLEPGDPLPASIDDLPLEPLKRTPPGVAPALLLDLFQLGGRTVRTGVAPIAAEGGASMGAVMLIHDMSPELAVEARVANLTRANEIIYNALAAGLQVSGLGEIAAYTPPDLSAEVAQQMPRGVDLALAELDATSATIRAYRQASAPALQRNFILQATEQIDRVLALARDAAPPFSALLALLVERWRPLITAEGGRLARAALSGPVKNPYVAGNPVRGELFVGREDIMRRLVALWSGASQRPSVILYGHRRMGKSSILRNLAAWLGPDTLVIDFNLQRIGQVEHTGDLFYTLALALYEALTPERQRLIGEPSEARFFERNPYTGLEGYIRELAAARGDLSFVVAIDEFEKLEQFIAAGLVEPHILDTFRGLVQTYPWFVLALAGLHTLEEMTHDYWNPLFGSVTAIPVSFLSPAGARQLITRPSPDFSLNYAPEAVELIVSLTNGQPYLVQLVGHGLVTRFNRQTFEEGREGERRFTADDVLAIIGAPEFHRDGHAYFDGVWSQARQGRPAGQAQVLEALAPSADGLGEAELAAAAGLELDALRAALQVLIGHDVLRLDQGRYSYTVELMRRWVLEGRRRLAAGEP